MKPIGYIRKFIWGIWDSEWAVSEAEISEQLSQCFAEGGVDITTFTDSDFHILMTHWLQSDGPVKMVSNRSRKVCAHATSGWWSQATLTAESSRLKKYLGEPELFHWKGLGWATQPFVWPGKWTGSALPWKQLGLGLWRGWSICLLPAALSQAALFWAATGVLWQWLVIATTE